MPTTTLRSLFSILIVLIALIFSPSARANFDLNKIAKHLLSYPMAIKNTFLSTLWGGCFFPTRTFLGPVQTKVGHRLPHNRYISHHIFKRLAGEHFEKKGFPAKIHLQKDFQKNKYPLIFIQPGIFGTLNGKGTLLLARNLYDQKYHVVILPSPVGPDYLRQMPKHPFGHFLDEAKVLLQGINEVHDHLQSIGAKIEQVNLMGISYGAFSSSVIRGLDSKSSNPIIDRLVLIAPPMNLYNGMKNIDENLDSIPQEQLKTHLIFNKLSRVVRLCRMSPSAEGPMIKNHQYAKTLVLKKGFFNDFLKSLKLAFKYHEQHEQFNPDWQEYKRIFDTDKSKIRFLPFIKIVPSVKNIYLGETSQLEYWIDKTPSNWDSTIILTSADDFLNHGGHWPRKCQIIRLKNGGHYGFKRLSWFADFLKIVFTHERPRDQFLGCPIPQVAGI